MRTPEDLPPVPGLRRGDVRQYEEPELGWSVPFHGEELTATVYVYPGTTKPGRHAEELAKEFDDAVIGLAAHARERGVEVVPLRESPGRVDLKNLDPSARSGSFLLRGSSESGPSSFEEIIVANAGDSFLKIRCTYTSNRPKKSGFQINGLLTAFKAMTSTVLTPMGNRMNWRSIWAVVAGVLFVIVVTTLIDVALHATHVYPPMNQPIGDSLALLATLYRVLVSVAGAWLTARLAPGKPMKHALILGCVGVVLGLMGLVATWNLGLGPRWYPVALVVLAIPQCWLGGKLYEMSRASAPTVRV